MMRSRLDQERISCVIHGFYTKPAASLGAAPGKQQGEGAFICPIPNPHGHTAAYPLSQSLFHTRIYPGTQRTCCS